MMLDEDLLGVLDEMAEWRKAFIRKCNEVKGLSSLIDLLRNELRISRDNEERIHSQLNKQQEIIIQLQELVSTFSEEKEKYIKICEEKENLLKEIEKSEKEFNEDRQKWEKEKLDILEKYEIELKKLKEKGDQDVYNLQSDVNRLNELNANTVQNFRNEMLKKEEDYKHSLSRTISNYEEELSKLNGDLAKAQTEIKLLRERCAASVNIYQTISSMDQRKYVLEHTKERKALNKGTMKYEPLPIVTCQSQIYKEPAETSLKPDEQSLNDGSFNDTQLNQTVRKPKLPVIKKRKLYSHVDDDI